MMIFAWSGERGVALEAQYETIKKQMGDTEYRARHILVKEKADAKTIIDNQAKGAKFEELAKQSIDPGSKEFGQAEV